MAEEYREELAKRKGFKSHEEYSKFLIERRKEKLEEIGKIVENHTKKPPEEILKKDEKVEKLIEKIEERRRRVEKEYRREIETKEIQQKIEFIPKGEVSKRRMFPPPVSKVTKTQVDRFDLMTNLFQKKVHECDLNHIKRDIIEAENLTSSIDRSAMYLPDDYQIKYYRLLDRYNDSVKFLEKKCKCNPEK